MRTLLLLTLLLIGCGLSQAAIARVGSPTQCDGLGITTSLSCAKTVTTGNAIVVGCSSYHSTVTSTSVTDGLNTYTQARAHKGTFLLVGIYAATNITGGALTFTCNFSASLAPNQAAFMVVNEYSGMATSSFVDAVNSAVGTSATMSPGAITTTASGDLVYSMCSVDVPSGTDTFTAATNYTLQGNQGDSSKSDGVSEDRILTGTSTETASITDSTGSRDFTCAVASFKAAGGGGGSAPIMRRVITLGD